MSKQPVLPPAPPTHHAAPPPVGRAFTLPRRVPPPAAAAPAGEQRQIEAMALSAVRLAALGPQLATLAGRMEAQADSQAQQAEAIAGATRELTGRLGDLIGRLQAASGNVQEVMADIARIADQTRILSINASIEAARAGEHGRAFSVVAREVQDLADQTRGSTRQIEARVQAIQGGIGEVAATVAPAATDPGDATGVTVQAVNRQVQVMASTAEGQRAGARSLRTLGDQTNRLTEELLLAVGTFRLAAHRRAGEDFCTLLADLASVVGDSRQREQVLQGCLQRHPGFELLYVTDPSGRQISANLGWKDGRVSADPAVLGRDWSDRPWFQDALRQAGQPVTSDIYRSTATGDYCFTISAAVRDAQGRTQAVLGADVNFQRLLADEARR